ncbi:MAG: cell division protein FtsZ [Chloroflexales bacterium]
MSDHHRQSEAVISAQEESGVRQIAIRVVGVGGAGGNVIDRLIAGGLKGADLIAVNTDTQALQGSRATTQICLGVQCTRGLGAGGNPQVGQVAAEESQNQLREALAGADMVFIVAGMGGGTGTGAAPVVAQIARDLGALTVGVVTRPFAFEGQRRAKVAEQGIAQLRTIADTIIIVPNERLIQASSRTTSMVQAFGMADSVLRYGIQGLVDLIVQHGLINVDFADIRAIMGESGPALLGIGVGDGADRATEAVRRAMSCPLLEGRIEGARRLLLNITGGEDLGLFEINRAAELATRTIDSEANIIFGAMIDPTLPRGKVKATLVATGFGGAPAAAARRPAPAETGQIAHAERQVSAAGIQALQRAPALNLSPSGPSEADRIDLPPFLLRFHRS